MYQFYIPVSLSVKNCFMRMLQVIESQLHNSVGVQCIHKLLLMSMYVYLTLSTHALEGYSSHFVCQSVCLSVCLSIYLSVCLSVCLSVADLEEGGLSALQRDTNLRV